MGRLGQTGGTLRRLSQVPGEPGTLRAVVCESQQELVAQRVATDGSRLARDEATDVAYKWGRATI